MVTARIRGHMPQASAVCAWTRHNLPLLRMAARFAAG